MSALCDSQEPTYSNNSTTYYNNSLTYYNNSLTYSNNSTTYSNNSAPGYSNSFPTIGHPLAIAMQNFAPYFWRCDMQAEERHYVKKV